jgi:hypothetical protein
LKRFVAQTWNARCYIRFFAILAGARQDRYVEAASRR